MKITDKQAAAVMFIAGNPGSKVSAIAEAAGVSASRSNEAEFLRRLVDSGLVQVVVTSDVQAVLDGDGYILDAPAKAFYDYFHALMGR